MQDVRVNDWMELTEALYEIPRNSHGRHRSDFVYRGLSDAAWSLDTSLSRLGGNYANVEAALLRTFRRYAEPGSIPGNSLWVTLSVAQHHGLPTRLLDWTVSPKIAVHFATAEPEHFDRDGAVWCVDVVKARAVLPRQLRDVLECNRAFLFSIEMLEFITDLNQFDELGQEHPFVLYFTAPVRDIERPYAAPIGVRSHQMRGAPPRPHFSLGRDGIGL